MLLLLETHYLPTHISVIYRILRADYIEHLPSVADYTEHLPSFPTQNVS